MHIPVAYTNDINLNRVSEKICERGFFLSLFLIRFLPALLKSVLGKGTNKVGPSAT